MKIVCFWKVRRISPAFLNAVKWSVLSVADNVGVCERLRKTCCLFIWFSFGVSGGYSLWSLSTKRCIFDCISRSHSILYFTNPVKMSHLRSVEGLDLLAHYCVWKSFYWYVICKYIFFTCITAIEGRGYAEDNMETSCEEHDVRVAFCHSALSCSKYLQNQA